MCVGVLCMFSVLLHCIFNIHYQYQYCNEPMKCVCAIMYDAMCVVSTICAACVPQFRLNDSFYTINFHRFFSSILHWSVWIWIVIFFCILCSHIIIVQSSKHTPSSLLLNFPICPSLHTYVLFSFMNIWGKICICIRNWEQI